MTDDLDRMYDRGLTVRIPPEETRKLVEIVVACDEEVTDPGSGEARRRAAKWVRKCVEAALLAGYRYPSSLAFMPPPGIEPTRPLPPGGVTLNDAGELVFVRD
jgi:hypothetical protein